MKLFKTLSSPELNQESITVVVTFKSVDNNSNESYSVVLSCGVVRFSIFNWNVFQFWTWPLLGVKWSIKLSVSWFQKQVWREIRLKYTILHLFIAKETYNQVIINWKHFCPNFTSPCNIVYLIGVDILLIRKQNQQNRVNNLFDILLASIEDRRYQGTNVVERGDHWR